MTTRLTPPFSLDTATQKVQLAENLWNGQDPEKIALAYTADSVWRNRTEFVQGRENIVQLLARKWKREHAYKLKKELFTFFGSRIAVHFQYEYHDGRGQWFRAYGNEHWDFDELGLMHTRDASINECAIDDADRQLR
jgi:nuclear transport factor 2 (NTF2) superfamily protein